MATTSGAGGLSDGGGGELGGRGVPAEGDDVVEGDDDDVDDFLRMLPFDRKDLRRLPLDFLSTVGDASAVAAPVAAAEAASLLLLRFESRLCFCFCSFSKLGGAGCCSDPDGDEPRDARFFAARAEESRRFAFPRDDDERDFTGGGVGGGVGGTWGDGCGASALGSTTGVGADLGGGRAGD